MVGGSGGEAAVAKQLSIREDSKNNEIKRERGTSRKRGRKKRNSSEKTT